MVCIHLIVASWETRRSNNSTNFQSRIPSSRCMEFLILQEPRIPSRLVANKVHLQQLSLESKQNDTKQGHAHLWILSRPHITHTKCQCLRQEWNPRGIINENCQSLHYSIIIPKSPSHKTIENTQNLPFFRDKSLLQAPDNTSTQNESETQNRARIVQNTEMWIIIASIVLIDK